MINVRDIADFMQEHCVGITNWDELDFSVHCSPKEVYIREENGRPFPVSRDFFEGVIFCNYDFFLNEVQEINQELEDYNKQNKK